MPLDPKKPHETPRSYQTKARTRELVIQQNKAAEALLSNPGSTARASASMTAHAITQIYREVPASHRPGLLARVAGDQGVAKGKSTGSVMASVHRVSRNDGSAGARDHAVVQSIAGDLGAALTDTGATTGMEGRPPHQLPAIQAAIARVLPSLHHTQVERVKALSDSGVVGPAKKEERSRTQQLVGRRGIHGMGDSTLLAEASPQEARISRDKLDRVIEPLQGHMSGSPGEITAIADAAAGDRRPFTRGMEGRHVGPLTGGSRARTEAASALASALLIGQGFHSAVEVYESVKKHQGEDIFQGRGDRGKRDASDVAGNGEATAFISDLMERHTAPKARELASSLKPSVNVSSTRSNSAGTLAKEAIFPATSEGSGPHRGTNSQHYGPIESRPPWH